MLIPSEIANRLATALKRFHPIPVNACDHDVGEADTSTIVKDVLKGTFGYDKYAEITAQYQIKPTYCDLALKILRKLSLLIEVTVLGVELEKRQCLNPIGAKFQANKRPPHS